MPLSLPAGLAVLRERNFVLYLAARLLGAFAVQMQSVAIGWQVYAFSGEVLDLGLVGLAQFLPFLILILPAGQAADRLDRRRIITVCFGINLLCALLLWLMTHRGLTSVWPVLAVLTLFGSARAFSMPASQAVLINLVPPQHFAQAVAINSSTFHVAVIAGPVLGGLLFLAGAEVVYGCVTLLLGASVALMLMLPRSEKKAASQEPASLRSVLEGLRFVFSRPIMLGAISLDLFAVLFGGSVAMLPAVARDLLHTDATGLGLLRSAPAIGAALTTALLALRPIQRHVGRWMFGGVALFGAATMLFSLSGWLWLSLVALLLMGAGDMVSVYIRHILVQSQTPDEIRGRVSAVSAVFIGASNELGEFESGAAAAWLGLRPSILVGGAATIGISLLWMRLFPQLRRMDRFPPIHG
ncbi:MFS transporter [Roseateles sp. DAIF2]|uniref:MFS transporter n=1 Tax=Roseateles sp. DAIF2 TaxID=2714952 RepID=UPI0018A25829|nr:MFS transporter [Roseateles sp. DAIF2]QPF73745.1 MFS transporter [Roseateles sp. DAIF2]